MNTHDQPKQLAKAIAYVEIAPDEPSAALASFMLRRYQRATFRPPAYEAPHRHNYQELFIVQSGHGVHTIDGQPIELLPRMVSVISKGQVHVVEHLTDFTGWLVRWSDDFLPGEALNQLGHGRPAVFTQPGNGHTMPVQQADLQALISVCKLLEAEWRLAPSRDQEQAIRHLLAVLLIRLERIFRNASSPARQDHEAQRTYQRFLALLEQNFAKRHDVQYYANELGLAPVRLSRIIGRMLGKPTKQVINERIVVEAKRFLHYTDMSITEIAVALGYNDLFQLSKLFKRITGLSPQAFRDQRQKMT